MSDCPAWMKGHKFQGGVCECGYQDIFIYPPPAAEPTPLFPLIVSTDVLIAEVRKKALNDVLDLIDEDRNICAYGSCGCAEAVKTLLEKT